jgi:hypothetical protein
MSRFINTPEVCKTLKRLSRDCNRHAKMYLKFAKEDRGTPLEKQWARDARRAFNYADTCAVAAEIVGQQPRCVQIKDAKEGGSK